jgi:hypothetical protein
MLAQAGVVPSGGLGIDTDGISAASSGVAQEFPEYRAVGLRAPLILVGWGYDTNGNPVPADPDNSGVFVDNHRQRQDLWKAGPLDARWDDERKVWEAGGGSTDLRVVKMRTAVLPGAGTGDADTGDPGSGNYMSGASYNIEGAPVLVKDYLYSLCACSGELIRVVPKTGYCEAVAEFGLKRKADLLQNLSYLSYAQATLDDIHSTAITVYDDLLQSGQIVNAGTKVQVYFDRTDNKWYVSAAQCIVP